MSNALPLGPGPRVFTAPRGLVMFNGNVLGFLKRCSGEESIRMEGIDVVGRLDKVEFAPTGYDVSCNASIYRTVARGLVSTADSPGSLKEQGIFPRRLRDILLVEGVDLVLVDTLTGKTLEFIQNAKAAGRNWDFDARSSMQQNISFVATRSADESSLGIVRRAA